MASASRAWLSEPNSVSFNNSSRRRPLKLFLLRFAGRDVVPLPLPLLRPAQDRRAGQLRAVIRDDHGRSAAGYDEGIELVHDPQTRQRGIGNQSQALPGEVVDDRQDAEATAVGQRIGQEVQAPALIGALGDRYRRSGSQSTLAPATPAHLQPFLAV